MISQAIITFFVLFALSRVLLRYKDQTISGLGTLSWTLFWTGILIIVWRPGLSDAFAEFFGIRRGTDVVIIASILLLFYAMFRIHVQFEMQEREITRLVRALALQQKKNHSS